LLKSVKEKRKVRGINLRKKRPKSLEVPSTITEDTEKEKRITGLCKEKRLLEGIL